MTADNGMTIDTPTETPTEGSLNPEAESQPANWYSGLPQEVQAWSEVQNAPDQDTFFKQMSDMRSMIGRSVQVPGPDASAEARQAYVQKMLEKTPEVMLKPDAENMNDFYNALGRPEAPDKYTAPEFGEDVYVDQSSVESFRKVAHDAGLSQKQFEHIVNQMTNGQTQAMQQQLQERNEQLQGLRGEWGMAFDQNLQVAEKVRQEFFPHLDVHVDKLDAPTIKALQNLGKALGGEGTPLTQETGASSVMTPAEAMQIMQEIMNNPDHPKHNPSMPGHKEAMARFLDLQDYAHGRDPADRKSFKVA